MDNNGTQRAARIATVPNFLTSFRFVAAPVLIWLALNGRHRAYLILLAVCFATDVLDGLIARLLHQESVLGSMLDSSADLVIYVTVPLTAWWLWPELILQELSYVLVMVASYAVPALAGVLKFGVFTSYHTWATKLAVLLACAAAYVMFVGGPTWPFRLATIFCVIAALEQITITMVLRERRNDVQSIWHVMRRRGGTL
ncbi:MAG: CDP-alcohol phosphatidyltransferase family protein [Gammaproteobacteria bacterium]